MMNTYLCRRLIMSLADYVPAEFMHFFENPGFVEALKGFARYLINEDLAFQEEIKTKFNANLATSEIRPVQRLAEIETVLGLMTFLMMKTTNPRFQII
jgi:hypothetical protein